MKICIIGTGQQGTGLAGLLAMEEDVDEIVLADKTLEIAARSKNKIISLAEKRKVNSITTVAINANDPKEVADACQGADVIFNGILPSFNIPIMKACLEVKANYLDLYSMPVHEDGVAYNETIDAQFDLHDNFLKNDITAVPCLGVNPGWSTMVGTYLINQFTRIDKVLMRTIDCVESQDMVSPVNASILFKHFLGPPHPMYYKDDNIHSIDIMDSEEEFEFPTPLGKRLIYCDAHTADLVLLPKYAGKKIGEIWSKGCVDFGDTPMKDVWIRCLGKQLAQHHDKEDVDWFEKLGSYLKTETDESSHESAKRIFTGRAFSSIVEVVGLKGKEICSHRMTLVTDFDVAVKHLPWSHHGVYCTIGTAPIEIVLAMGRGEIYQKGVISVAELDTSLIIKRVAKRGHRIWENIEVHYE